MLRFLNKIKSFIVMDVSNEGEAKDFAVLLRLISIGFFINTIASSIYLASLYHFFLAVLGILFLGGAIGAFILTYENKTNMAFGTLITSLILSAVIYSLTAGWRFNYQWNLILAILVIFYTLDIELKTKLKYALLLGATLVACAIYAYIFPVYRDSRSIYSFLFDIIICVYYIYCISSIAYYFCTKFNIAEEKLRDYNMELQTIASHDALTQLPNRRNMVEHLNTLVYEYNRNSTPFCVAIADIDFFKKVNDNYGHDTGDYILKSVSDIFSKTMEGRGMVARWGGEEFLFTFEGMSGSQASNILNNMRAGIEHTEFSYRDYTLNITITVGVEEFSPITGLDLSISSADKKLYAGKQNGRNQVVFK